MATVFYLSALIAATATLMVITSRNAVRAMLYLIVSLLAVAQVFFVLGAPFAAMLEVIVYAGAIMVLFVFVVMMLNLGGEAANQERLWLTPAMWAGPSVLSLMLLAEVLYMFARSEESFASAGAVGASRVGAALFGPYVLAVELASMLLLAGMVGAFHLGRRRHEKESA